MQRRLKTPSRQKPSAESIVLVALALIALAVGLALVPRGEVALADLLFQSPPTNTPDPNSPLSTPTPTWTPFPTDTPTPLETPTDTPPLPPTDTPVPRPTDTPVVFPTDTPRFELPSDTPTAPALAPQPTATPDALLAPPVPPTEPTLTGPLTMTLEIIDIVPLESAAGERAAEPAVQPRRLDAALFIDNMVIAFGYVWMCFGVLAMMAAALGGFWLWRRRAQPPAQRVPDPGTAPAPPPATGSGATPSVPPPPPARPAARRTSPPPKDLD